MQNIIVNKEEMIRYHFMIELYKKNHNTLNYFYYLTFLFDFDKMNTDLTSSLSSRTTFLNYDIYLSKISSA